MGSPEMKGFCAAPWVEGITYANGKTLTCCRNDTSFGNWMTDGLQKAWHSPAFQEFRKKIAQGEFPDNSCRNCYHNGTARSLMSELTTPFNQNRKRLFSYLQRNISEIDAMESQFSLRDAATNTSAVLNLYFSTLDDLEKQSSSYPAEIEFAISKLRVIGRIAKAYLEKDPLPPVVAPFRQVQLIAKCNARCIQCPGLFTGEIINGPSLDEKYVTEAFSHTEGMIDFFMNGSEFLLYPKWKEVAANLVSNGIQLSISTNGILLTPSNVQYLIDNQIVQNLNISMDGATKKTLEDIRVNVKYEKLIRNIEFLISYVREKQYDFTLSFSFVLMRRNYHEFPDLVRVVSRLRDGNGNGRRSMNPFRRQKWPPMIPFITVYCQALENYDTKEYREFVEKEHHTLIEKEDLVKTFKKALVVSKREEIPVSAFYYCALEEFINQGCAFPPLAPS